MLESMLVKRKRDETVTDVDHTNAQLINRQALQKIRTLGQQASCQGSIRPTLTALQAQNDYTEAQARAYLEGFDASAGDETTQALRRARNAGQQAAHLGLTRPTLAILQARNHYTEEQARAYLEAFEASAGDEKTQALRKARTMGQQAARQGCVRPTLIALQARNRYTREQAYAYLESFDASVDDQTTQALRKAHKIGQQAAHQGFVRPTVTTLQERNGYTKEQANAYLEGYEASAGDEKTQALRKARSAGHKAACHGCTRPTVTTLQERNDYTKAQAHAYLEGYDESIGNEETQAFRKEKKEIRTLVRNGVSDEVISTKTPQQLNQFHLEKERLARSTNIKNLQRIKKAGFALGSSRGNKPCLTDEHMRNVRNYSEIEIQEYKQAYEKGREAKRKKQRPNV